MRSDELDDPTGIRSMLRALPEPGPMPEEVVQRIQARLGVEQAHRTPRPAPGTLAGRGDSFIDLAAERSHRRPARAVALLGAAAAGLVVATVAISQVVGGNTPLGDSAASVYTPARSAQYSAAEAATEGDDQEAGGADQAAAGDEAAAAVESDAADGSDASAESGATAAAGDPDDGEGGTQLQAAEDDSGVLDDVRGPADIPVELLPRLGEVGPGQDFAAVLVRAAGQNSSARSTLTAAQAHSCWASVASMTGDSASSASYYAAPATVEGQPAVALLAMGEDGSGQAWLMPGRCTDQIGTQPLAETAVTP